MSSSPSASRRLLALGDTPLPEVSVRNWPLVDGGWRAISVVLLTGAVVVVAALVGGSIAMGGLAGTAVIAAMHRFWAPVYYAFRSRGIEERTLFRTRLIPWRHVRSCQIQSRGVLVTLSHYGTTGGRDRRVFIEWHEQREEVLHAIDFYCRTSLIFPA